MLLYSYEVIFNFLFFNLSALPSFESQEHSSPLKSPSQQRKQKKIKDCEVAHKWK